MASYLKEAGDLGRQVCVVDVALEEGDEERLDRARHLRFKLFGMIQDGQERQLGQETDNGPEDGASEDFKQWIRLATCAHSGW